MSSGVDKKDRGCIPNENKRRGRWEVLGEVVTIWKEACCKNIRVNKNDANEEREREREREKMG